MNAFATRLNAGPWTQDLLSQWPGLDLQLDAPDPEGLRGFDLADGYSSGDPTRALLEATFDPSISANIAGNPALAEYLRRIQQLLCQSNSRGAIPSMSDLARSWPGSTALNPMMFGASGDDLVQMLIMLANALERKMGFGASSAPAGGSFNGGSGASSAGGYAPGGSGGGGGGGGSGGGGGRYAGTLPSQTWATGTPLGQGDNTSTTPVSVSVVPSVGGNSDAYAIAQSVLGQSISDVKTSGPLAGTLLPAPNDVSCASFVSACLLKAGQISAGDCTTNVERLNDNLRNNPNWSEVALKDAKPGDVVTMSTNDGPYGHVVMFAGWSKDGSPVFIGSNNPNGGEQHITQTTMNHPVVAVLHYHGPATAPVAKGKPAAAKPALASGGGRRPVRTV